MDKHSNDTGDVEPTAPRTDHPIKLILIAGAGQPAADSGSDAEYERLMDELEHHQDQRRRRHRMIAFVLSAASAVLGYSATLHFLSR